jgi:hypothetical protein
VRWIRRHRRCAPSSWASCRPSNPPVADDAPPPEEAVPPAPEVPLFDEPLDDDALADPAPAPVVVVAGACEPLGTVTPAEFGVVTSGRVRGTASETWAPPQAPRTVPASSTPTKASDRLAPVTGSVSERTHPASAAWAVVEVALGELIAPRAEPQVLDGPREPGRGWRERKHLADDLERLARFTIDVDAARLGLADDLATGFCRAHPVALSG